MYRFVDRDMLMRYHVGLGVGHVYAHRSSTTESDQAVKDSSQEEDMETSNPESVEAEGEDRAGSTTSSDSIVDSESGSEHSLDRDNDSDSGKSEDLHDSDEDDAMDEMYGSDYFEY
jgi:hypothetical protein